MLEPGYPAKRAGLPGCWRNIQADFPLVEAKPARLPEATEATEATEEAVWAVSCKMVYMQDTRYHYGRPDRQGRQNLNAATGGWIAMPGG